MNQRPPVPEGHPVLALGRRSLRLAWAAPASFVGLALAALACALGATARRHAGVLEVAGGAAASLGGRFVAITFGHVVLGRSHELLDRWRTHEHAHVRQYERLGPLFWPLYLGDSAWLWLRGERPYLDNRFERQARLADLHAQRARRGGRPSP